MFEIKHIANNNLLLEHLHIVGPDLSARIYPNLGASLQALKIKGQSVIALEANALPNSYWKTFSSALLFPFVGRIAKGTYKYQAQTYTLPINEPERQNAIHGLVFDKSFRVLSIDTTATEARISCQHQQTEKTPGFPFHYELKVNYTFTDSGCTVAIQIKNTDSCSFPFALGWHPYFTTPCVNESRVTFDASEEFITDTAMIPTKSIIISNNHFENIGTQHLDHSYYLSSPQTNFHTPNYTLSVTQKGSPHNYLQLFTPEHRKALALEPMTALPNAFNNKQGLMELAPKALYTCQWDLKLTHS